MASLRLRYEFDLGLYHVSMMAWHILLMCFLFVYNGSRQYEIDEVDMRHDTGASIDCRTLV